MLLKIKVQFDMIVSRAALGGGGEIGGNLPLEIWQINLYYYNYDDFGRPSGDDFKTQS